MHTSALSSFGATLGVTEVLCLRYTGKEKLFEKEKYLNPFGWVEEALHNLLELALVFLLTTG